MPLETLFISGPPASGKTTTARLVADEAVRRPVHYLRMVQSRDGHTNQILDHPGEADGARWASVHTVHFTPDRVFELVPEALRTVRRLQRNAFVLIEADGEAALRHAYPYEYRVFVTGCPSHLSEIFRDPQSAAAALHQMMQDTASFASEVFGVFEPGGLDDSVGVEHVEPHAGRSGVYVEELQVNDQQIRHFLNSPLGADIASRIQLQPEYHALVESDITMINTGTGSLDILETCVQRLEKLLSRVRHDARKHSVLYWGDVMDAQDPSREKLIRRLKALLAM